MQPVKASSVFGRLKTQLFCPQDWQVITIGQFIDAVDACICWCREGRIKMPLGFPSPSKYRASLGPAA